MTAFVPERRQSPRASIPFDSWLSVPSTSSVRLLDIGLGGVAFSSAVVLEPGRNAAIRVTLDGEPFSSEVRVCWSQPRDSTNGPGSVYEIGVAFLTFDESSRRALEKFLKVSRSV